LTLVELFTIVVSQGDIIMDKGFKKDIIALLKKGKCYNEVASALNCAKSTIAYHSKCSGIKSKHCPKILTKQEIVAMIKFYEKNSAVETAKYFGVSKTTVLRHCPVKQRNLLTKDERRTRNYYRVKTRRQQIKQKAVEYKGNKCELCGYSKCIVALEFHHRNPKKKEFSLSTNRMYHAWATVKKELDKCILVCSNCHRELHYKEANGKSNGTQAPTSKKQDSE
jgi:hypothetical protein